MSRIQNIMLAGMALCILSGCSLGRMLIFTYSDINDHKKFPKQEIAAPQEKFQFFEAPESYQEAHPIRATTLDSKYRKLDDYLPETKTVAFLVIRNDSILYERYFDDYNTASIVPSFSMAKSFVSALFGIAMEEGLIGSVEDPMTRYLPELKGEEMDRIKIKHLLKMTSGLQSDEKYKSPFSGVAQLYYGHNLRTQCAHVKIQGPPGLAFEYKSMNTQLLGAILERTTKKSLSELLEEKIWKPLGMEYPASWSVDRKKDPVEKAFCCLNARARDYAKFGRLYLNQGNWNGEQIVPKKWVTESTKVDSKDGSAWFYQYQWWLPSREGDFMAQGHLGQFIYVNPKENYIMVRLGAKDADVAWDELFREIVKKSGVK